MNIGGEPFDLDEEDGHIAKSIVKKEPGINQPRRSQQKVALSS
jgi:hypothetical protein